MLQGMLSMQTAPCLPYLLPQPPSWREGLKISVTIKHADVFEPLSKPNIQCGSRLLMDFTTFPSCKLPGKKK